MTLRWLRWRGKTPPPHTHDWKTPEFDMDSLATQEGVNFMLLGQVCDCGAMRVFDGPTKGFRMIKEGK